MNVAAAEQVLVVAASSADRSTMRRYFRDHNVACRSVPDMNSALDVVSRYRVSFVIINATQFTPAAILDFVADASDLADLPALVMLTPAHKHLASELGRIHRADAIMLPASLREIRLKMQQMLSVPQDCNFTGTARPEIPANLYSDAEIHLND